MAANRTNMGDSNTLIEEPIRRLTDAATVPSTSSETARESRCSDLNIKTKDQSISTIEIRPRLYVGDLEASVDNEVSLERRKKAAWLRYVVFNVYRRLFSIVFIGNLVAFILVMVRNQRLVDMANASAANMLVVGLSRQNLVVNALFVTFAAIPRSAPLYLRKHFAKIYCMGGVHSGCGMAAFIWYTGLTALLTRQYISQSSEDPIQITPAIMTLSYLNLVLLMSIIVAAYPTIRRKLHDYFELTHRFCGWGVVLVFWPLLFLFAVQIARSREQSLGRFLIGFPAFWLIIINTVSALHPWVLLRRVPVRAEPLSSHAIRLHLSHTTIKFGQGLSFAKHPLHDWHAFAAFPDLPALPGTSGTTKENPTFSCLVSRAGDWTSDTIARPPTHLWKRAVPTHGFAYAMKVFRSVIVVTTGSGIGPCLGFVGDPNRPVMRVLWQTRTPLKTYGQSIMDLVNCLDSDAIIIDTNVTGKRVDMLPYVLELVRQINAEAVCVISNPVMTKKLIFECEARGIAAFGPNFDS